MEKKIVQVSSLRNQAADIIRSRIFKGEMKSGEKLSERHLSVELGISTTPIKEAFRLLQSEGLIVTVPRKGSYVSENVSGGIVQFTFLRSAIEGVAAYFAAKYATKEQIANMQKFLDEANALIKLKDISADITSLNESFHEEIRNSAKNLQIMQLGSNMQVIDELLRKRVNLQDLHGIKIRHKEHQDILNLIKKHNSEDAETLMVKHVRLGISRLKF